MLQLHVLHSIYQRQYRCVFVFIPGQARWTSGNYWSRTLYIAYDLAVAQPTASKHGMVFSHSDEMTKTQITEITLWLLLGIWAIFTNYKTSWETMSSSYHAAGFSQNVANSAAIPQPFIQSRNNAHNQRVTMPLSAFIIIPVIPICTQS